MLSEFNEGRSKSCYCIAATVMEIDELRAAIDEANARSQSLNLKDRARIMHSVLDEIAREKGYYLHLRK